MIPDFISALLFLENSILRKAAVRSFDLSAATELKEHSHDSRQIRTGEPYTFLPNIFLTYPPHCANHRGHGMMQISLQYRLKLIPVSDRGTSINIVIGVGSFTGGGSYQSSPARQRTQETQRWS